MSGSIPAREFLRHNKMQGLDFCSNRDRNSEIIKSFIELFVLTILIINMT